VLVFKSARLLEGGWASLVVVMCGACFGGWGGDSSCLATHSHSILLSATTTRPSSGWRFEGLVAQADSDALGIDWECESPVVVALGGVGHKGGFGSQQAGSGATGS